MSLYQVNENIVKVFPSSFKDMQMKERDIQTLVKKYPDVLDENGLLIISEELKASSESEKRLDLLALDKNGDLVVIEFKRDDDGFHMDLQALRYSAMVSQYNRDDVERIYTDFLAKNSADPNISANERINAFLEDNDIIPCQNVRIILANQDFSKELTSCVLWLNEQGLDISCVKITPYKLNNETIWDVDKIIPLKGAEEYFVKKREKEQQEKKERSNREKYSFNGEIGLSKAKLAFNFVVKYVEDNPSISYEQLSDIFPKEKQSDYALVKRLDELTNVEREYRYGIRGDEQIKLNDGSIIVVCNRWDSNFTNMNKLIQKAEELGYQISID